MRTTSKVIACALVAMSTHTASALPIPEIEPNNDFANAHDLGLIGPGESSITIEGAIELGDVDWFTFTLTDTATFANFVAYAQDDESNAELQFVDEFGDVLIFGSDEAGGFDPLINAFDTSAGRYFVGISGFGDAPPISVLFNQLFDGQGHSEQFSYRLELGFNVVPSPSTGAILLPGLLLGARRRR
jgi:hypothetical protein